MALAGPPRHSIITGTSVGAGTGEDYATIKYSSTGSQLWVARYNGPGNSSDTADGIKHLAVSASGCVYVTGTSVGSGTDKDYATLKYDSAGTQVWEARYNGPASAEDRAMALVLDADENAYVTGWSTGNGTGQDYATVKYRANGDQLWYARYDGPGSQDDEAVAIALDTSNHVCVSGNSYDASASSDYLTVSYDLDGTERWFARCMTRVGSHQTPTERFLTVKYAQVGIDQFTPSSVQAGGSSFTLTVDGFGFLDGATALWNGSARPTTFINSSQLTVDIPAADIASEAEVTTAAITVVNSGWSHLTLPGDQRGQRQRRSSAERDGGPWPERERIHRPNSGRPGGYGRCRSKRRFGRSGNPHRRHLHVQSCIRDHF